MKMSAQCIGCIMGNRERSVRGKGNEETRMAFLKKCMQIMLDAKDETMPWLTTKMDLLYEEMFPQNIDYASIKHKYNQMMLQKEEAFIKQIETSEDPLKMSIQFAQTGNYIDFGALSEVKDDVLEILLKKCAEKPLDQKEYTYFKEDLSKAKNLLYICDNCGEVVLDKYLIKEIRKQYPHLNVKVMVRGGEVINDASRVDAKEVGLYDVCEVCDSGIAMCGCDVDHISEEALNIVKEADVIIAKGQANFETLYGNGYPVYYLLLCKCDMFVSRFAMEKFAPVFMKENRIIIHNK